MRTARLQRDQYTWSHKPDWSQAFRWATAKSVVYKVGFPGGQFDQIQRIWDRKLVKRGAPCGARLRRGCRALPLAGMGSAAAVAAGQVQAMLVC